MFWNSRIQIILDYKCGPVHHICHVLQPSFGVCFSWDDIVCQPILIPLFTTKHIKCMLLSHVMKRHNTFYPLARIEPVSSRFHEPSTLEETLTLRKH